MGGTDATGSTKGFVLAEPYAFADVMTMLEIFYPTGTSLESFFGDLQVSCGFFRFVPDEGVREQGVLLLHLNKPIHKLFFDFWEF